MDTAASECMLTESSQELNRLFEASTGAANYSWLYHSQVDSYSHEC